MVELGHHVEGGSIAILPQYFKKGWREALWIGSEGPGAKAVYYVFSGAFEGGEKIIKFTVAESEQISTCKEDLLDFLVPGKKSASL